MWLQAEAALLFIRHRRSPGRRDQQLGVKDKMSANERKQQGGITSWNRINCIYFFAHLKVFWLEDVAGRQRKSLKWSQVLKGFVGSQSFINKESQSTHTMQLSGGRLNEAPHTHSEIQNNSQLRHAVTVRLIFSNTPSRLRDLTKCRAAIAAAPLVSIHADKRDLSHLISLSFSLYLSLSLLPAFRLSLSPSSGFYSNTRAL